MATYEKAKTEIHEMAADILAQFETHAPTVNAGVKIDFVMAYGKRDDDGNIVGDAIRSQGQKALGLCSVINTKDRSKGNGDAEITLDGDWWANAPEPKQRALLDHELHHIVVIVNKAGVVKQDDLGRPKLRMRKHDHEFGWFKVIAERHGADSQECVQAKEIASEAGQLYWPSMFGGVIQLHEAVNA